MNPNEPNYGQVPQAPQTYTPPQPNTTAAPAQAPTQNANPYDFIINPSAAPQKKSAISRAKGPMRLLLGVGVVGVLLLIVGVVVAQLLPKGASGESLLGVVQQQQEIIRVSTQAQQSAQSETIKGFAYTVNLSVSTSQQQLQTYITSKGTKIDQKQLGIKQDPATDKLLENAKATSTYDSAVRKVLGTLLQDYLDELQQVYKTADSDTLKNILNVNFTAGKTLLVQAENVSV